MSQVRRFAAAGWTPPPGRRTAAWAVVGALDESGQQKKGVATGGVKRQHMGCAGGIDNGINTVHLAYVRDGPGMR